MCYHSGQSRPGRDGNNGVFRIPQSSTIRLFSVISRTLIGGDLNLRQRNSRCILQPQPTGQPNRQGLIYNREGRGPKQRGEKILLLLSFFPSLFLSTIFYACSQLKISMKANEPQQNCFLFDDCTSLTYGKLWVKGSIWHHRPFNVLKFKSILLFSDLKVLFFGNHITKTLIISLLMGSLQQD